MALSFRIISLLLFIYMFISSAYSQRMMPFSFWTSCEKRKDPYLSQNKEIDSTSIRPESGNTAENQKPSISAFDEFSAVDTPGHPEYFHMDQNYPNPFGHATLSASAETIIPLTISSPIRISVQIFDVFSRPLNTLFEGELPAGFHEFRFKPPANLPSGSYLIGAGAGGRWKWIRFIYVR